jgi:O-antigen ligase
MIAAPLLVGLVALSTGSAFQERMRLGVAETIDYAQRNEKSTSIGLRLNFWHRSLQAIAEKPLTGHGVGSWRQQFLRLEGPGASLGSSLRSNPHQEFLQWGVQLGLPGIALVLALIVCLLRDARGFEQPARQALQSVVAVFAVACLFNSALFDALIGDYFCLSLGLLLACGLVGLHDTPQTTCTAPSLAGRPA